MLFKHAGESEAVRLVKVKQEQSIETHYVEEEEQEEEMLQQQDCKQNESEMHIVIDHHLYILTVAHTKPPGHSWILKDLSCTILKYGPPPYLTPRA